MSAGNARKPSGRQSLAPTETEREIERLNEAARRYLDTLLEYADWIGRELGLCLSPTYRADPVVADGYCKALRCRLRPTVRSAGQVAVGLVDGRYRALRLGPGPQGLIAFQPGEEIDMHALAGYGVEPMSLMSALSRSVLGEDFPRATSWLWRLLDQLPADVWGANGQPPAASIVDDWRKATDMLRGCLASRLPGMQDDFADVEGLPPEIASILSRGDFPALSADEYAKLGVWLTADAPQVYRDLDPANVTKTRRIEEAKKRLRAILEYNAALRQAAAPAGGAGAVARAESKEQPWADDAPEHSCPPESRCAAMKKTEIAARILNRTNTKNVRPREVAHMMSKCGLRDEGNGKWSIRLDASILSAEAIGRLRMTEWPPPPDVK